MGFEDVLNAPLTDMIFVEGRDAVADDKREGRDAVADDKREDKKPLFGIKPSVSTAV
jgi:hypothetical protein